MKTIMILGAGVYQLPLIKKAKEMDLLTIVVSKKGDYPGIKIADKFFDVDTTDTEKILKLAKELKIDAITTTGTDVCVPTIGKVVDEMGLVGVGFKAAKKSMDKTLMKKAFVEGSVPTAKFKMFTDKQVAYKYANNIGYPVMIKATDSSGSRGITKVNTPTEFDFAWERAINVSKSKEIIIEEFLEGIEFGAQAFITSNVVTEVFAHNDTVTPAPFFTPIGHSIPTMFSEDIKKQIKEVIEKAVKAIGLKDCISNIDLMLVGNQVKMIEIGARMGATCLAENISIYSGIDAYEYLIRLALGENPTIATIKAQPNACLLLRSKKTGTLKKVIIPEHIKNHPALVELQIDIKEGDKVKSFEVGPDRIGHIIVKAENYRKAEEIAENLYSKIELKII